MDSNSTAFRPGMEIIRVCSDKIILRASSLYKRFQGISEPGIPKLGFNRLGFEFSVQKMLSREFLPESLRSEEMPPPFWFLLFFFFW